VAPLSVDSAVERRVEELVFGVLVGVPLGVGPRSDRPYAYWERP
jgi:hypothetical protein